MAKVIWNNAIFAAKIATIDDTYRRKWDPVYIVRSREVASRYPNVPRVIHSLRS